MRNLIARIVANLITDIIAIAPSKEKKEIAKFGWFYNRKITPKELGKLDKGKIHCSCPLCRYEQRYGIPKLKYQIEEQEAEKEIKEYC